MNKVEIWIDVEYCGAEGTETLGTLFANHEMPTRPFAGETLRFLQSKGSAFEFSVVSPIGSTRENTVSVEVEDVGHYAVNSNGTVVFKTAVRCAPIVVPTREDARTVCRLMTEQLGFEVDQYAINKLLD